MLAKPLTLFCAVLLFPAIASAAESTTVTQGPVVNGEREYELKVTGGAAANDYSRRIIRVQSGPGGLQEVGAAYVQTMSARFAAVPGGATYIGHFDDVKIVANTGMWKIEFKKSGNVIATHYVVP